MAWHDGRTFYACPCGWRDERTGDDAPASLPCGCGGSMAQWVPPAVARERAATMSQMETVAEPIGTLI